jgi:hypothetical protein
MEETLMRDPDQLREFARRYAEAWCSHDPARVAEHYQRGATIAINGGEPTGITEVARSFISAIPDIQVFMDDVVCKDDTDEFHWTFTGTNTGPGGTGIKVQISGFEEWTIGEEGLITASLGHYDQADYDRQLEHGAGL